MKFEPFLGLGELTFGASREHIRNVLGQYEFREFKRNEFAENYSDYYHSIGLFMEYNERNELEAIEVSEDSNSNIQYEDKDLRTLTYIELKKMFDMSSKDKEEEGDIGVVYHDLGVSINRINRDDEHAIILLFSRGYW